MERKIELAAFCLAIFVLFVIVYFLGFYHSAVCRMVTGTLTQLLVSDNYDKHKLCDL